MIAEIKFVKQCGTDDNDPDKWLLTFVKCFILKSLDFFGFYNDISIFELRQYVQETHLNGNNTRCFQALI